MMYSLPFLLPPPPPPPPPSPLPHSHSPSPSLPPSLPPSLQLDNYRHRGGIRALSKAWEENERVSVGENSPKNSISDIPRCSNSTPSNPEPPPLPARPPGKAIFTSPPSLIEELYPPGVTHDGASSLEQTLLQVDVQEGIREVICGGWLETCFAAEPAPLNIWQWLFQIMCRSSEVRLSDAALRTLVSLQDIAVRRGDSASICPPTIPDVIDALVSLGADESQLTSGGGDQMEFEEVFESLQPPLANLAGLVRYLATCLRTVPNRYTVLDAEKVILLLLNTALDSHISRSVLAVNISDCIAAALAVVPDDSWPGFIEDVVLSAVSISGHHHNRLSLAISIIGVSKRSKQLQRNFCRRSIEDLLGLPKDTSVRRDRDGSEEGDRADVERREPESDCLFVFRVFQHYSGQSPESVDYYCMHSVLTLLLLFAHPSELRWPSEERREEFKKILENLNSRIHDRDLSQRDRIPVKDLLIRMKLQLGNSRTGDLKQASLPGF